MFAIASENKTWLKKNQRGLSTGELNNIDLLVGVEGRKEGWGKGSS